MRAPTPRPKFFYSASKKPFFEMSTPVSPTQLRADPERRRAILRGPRSNWKKPQSLPVTGNENAPHCPKTSPRESLRPPLPQSPPPPLPRDTMESEKTGFSTESDSEDLSPLKKPRCRVVRVIRPTVQALVVMEAPSVSTVLDLDAVLIAKTPNVASGLEVFRASPVPVISVDVPGVVDLDQNPVKKRYGRCPHGRHENYCKQCGGKCLCEHGIRKDGCYRCGTVKKCHHDKIKKNCKECCPCPHGKARPWCRDCKGLEFCLHGKSTATCDDCKKDIICEHGVYRFSCEYCDPNCPCGLYITMCPKCRPRGLCPHDRVRHRCRKCNPKVFAKKKITKRCEAHNVIAFRCTVCRPDLMCEHKNQKARCKKCKHPENICEHGEFKFKCSTCGKCKHGILDIRCKKCKFPEMLCEHEEFKSKCTQCGKCKHGIIVARCPVCKYE